MNKSELEAKFRAAWKIFSGRIPLMEEYQFHPIRRWRFDFAAPHCKLAIEIDGGQWTPHGGRHARDSDREKHNAAAVLGWRVLRYSSTMLDDPVSVVEEVIIAMQI